MAEPTNTEIKTLIESHMASTRDRDARDAEWRGGMTRTLETLTNEMGAMRKRQDETERRVEETQRAHQEIKRMAKEAHKVSEDLESRALVAIATLTQTQEGHGAHIKEIQKETTEQTLTLAKILTGVKLAGLAAAASPVLVGALWWLFQHLAH